MSTTGEKTFSTAGREVKTVTFKPITPGNYTLKLGSDVSIAKADKPDAVPYINLSFEVLETAESEGGKNKRVFHRLFIGMKPGKDGVLNMDRENQLTALAAALGTQVEGVEIVSRDAQNEDGDSVTIEYLNPKQIVEFIKSFAGSEVKGRIKTEKGTGSYGDKSVVQKFLLAE
jgi:hypothetical protein